MPDDLNKLAGDVALLKKPDNLTVACYVFPNYHPSAIHDKLYAPGWTEYNLIRSARPWFDGHAQPRTPLLGELDESKPSTWEKYNQLAKQHGIDVYIWDWYWYDGEPALHEALENGFLRASNANDVKFACMWTNHPWYILYPTLQTNGRRAYPPSHRPPDKTVEECWRSLSYMISRYFHMSNYWRIDGKPVLCIWDPNSLEKSIGLPAVKKLFAELRDYARKLGHPGIHIHSSGFYSPNSVEAGYDTAGSYNPLDWMSRRYQSKNQELCDYGVAAADVAFKLWPEHKRDFKVPYIPALAPGWDSTPRYIAPPSRPEKPNRDAWPACTIFKNESPAAFKAFVQASFAYLNRNPEVPRIITIACFNEWSEGHYLLPDNRFGYGMLDALAEALEIKNTHNQHGGGR
ncbi:glycoside hydrolase family 99-like domain-containing protein [Ereboglobus sp. PH5-5]|uniref:glycosyltransferase WbsX family protein n=1 Tax=Ereboglobus sp. PH5-5 TaxID=2940529 RepID=UPI002406397D|nr:glycoside hydrolase family 99-like domain-containing protein [Ereboglobus sp. PH5-5]